MTKKTKARIIIGSIAAIGVGILDAFFLEKYFFQVKEIFLGKKESRGKIKMVFLTDLHFRIKLHAAERRLARKINELNPDLILISGDVIDENGLYAPAKEFFNLVEKSVPKVAIMGNHDYKNRVKLQTYKQLYAQNNATLLINESVAFIINSTRLMITGVDDFIEGHGHFEKAIRNVGTENHHLLLIHSPLQQETILKELKEINSLRLPENKLNIQYIFAGHNHGGQVQFFGYAPVLPPKAGNYLKGWYNSEPPYLYLSRGFGTSTFPVRFGARAEMTVFYLAV